MEQQAETLPIITMTGALIGLGPLRRELIPAYCRWTNDLAVSSTLWLSWPETYERRAAAGDAAWFTVHELASRRPVGVACLDEIAQRHGRASFGIVIGAAGARGRGFGAEATRLTLDYAATVLGLSNVMLAVYAFNAGGLRAYTEGGFSEFGRRRRRSRHGAHFHDLVYMECLADEFVRLSGKPRA